MHKILFETRRRQFIDHLIPFHREWTECISQSWPPGFWIAWLRQNKEGIPFAVLASMHEKLFSSHGLYPISFETLQECRILYSFSTSLSTRLFPLQWLDRYRLSEWPPS